MKNCKEVLQEICNVISGHYGNVKGAYEAYDTFERAIKKYGVTVSQLSLGIANVDYEKIIWQIMADLRYARNLDLDYDEMAAGYDSYYLTTIANIIKEKGECEGIIETSAIDESEYRTICKDLGLI